MLNRAGQFYSIEEGFQGYRYDLAAIIKVIYSDFSNGYHKVETIFTNKKTFKFSVISEALLKSDAVMPIKEEEIKNFKAEYFIEAML